MSGRAFKIAFMVVLAAVACVFVPVTGANAATAFACRVDYSTNDWGSGFSATVKVNNVGTSSVSGWTVTFSYAGNQALQQGWNGTWSQSGRQVTVTNASWNASVPAGGSVSPGANFSYSGT